MRRTAAVALVIACAAATARAQTFDPYASALDQQQALSSGALTSEALVQQELARIAAVDRAGPQLNSIIVLNPRAAEIARERDAERSRGRVRGPLHGLPILVKDNIETADGTATTAGSLALADNVTGRDAHLVRRLQDAGAVILGKTNLSEWANYRSTHSVSGWSGVGGLVRNPYALDRNACGSSSGSGAAVAAGLAAAAIGTETDGSITCPAAMNGLVGLKPTLGLVSRTFVVPLSPEQDTPGPMTRTVADAAAVLTAIAGSDPADPATRLADAHRTDYLKALDRNALRGARIGVLRMNAGASPHADVLFDQALARLKAAGAVLVQVKPLPEAQMQAVGKAEQTALNVEFKAALDAYLETTPGKIPARSLAQLIAFDAREPRETALFGQEIFEAAQKSPPPSNPAYRKARATARRLAGPEGLARIMREARVEALVGPTGSPAWVTDPADGDHDLGSYSTLPAVAGYPHLTVPMGQALGLPVGLSFIGPRWSEARLLALGYAFEQAQGTPWRAPAFAPSVSLRPDVASAFAPR